MTDLQPSTPPLDRRPDGGRPGQAPPWYVAAVIAVLLTILAIVVVLLVRSSGSDTETTSTSTTIETTTTSGATTETTGETTSSLASTTASTEPSTVSSASTSTTADSTTSTLDPDQYLSAVWPWADSSLRYAEPGAAAEGFAVEFLGFRDPVIGPFQQGDTRSGEIEIRPTDDGPITTVFVRQLGPDDSWWVLGSATANIEIDEPGTLDVVDSPLVVSGRALAFEGMVGIELRADGSVAALVDDVMVAGGAAMEPFTGEFEWANPGSGGGTLILRTVSGEDGRPWEAAVRRVVFE